MLDVEKGKTVEIETLASLEEDEQRRQRLAEEGCRRTTWRSLQGRRAPAGAGQDALCKCRYPERRRADGTIAVGGQLGLPAPELPEW
jgi:hypothetical protein